MHWSRLSWQFLLNTLEIMKTHLLLLLTYGAHLVTSSHFRGGTIQWRPLSATPGSFNTIVCAKSWLQSMHSHYKLQIEITHRVAWRRSSGYYCDQSSILSNTLYGGGSLYCQSGCSGTVGSMSFYCTSYSFAEDWTAGERTYTYSTGGITSFKARCEKCF